MLRQEIPTYIKTCWECQRLELLAKRATVELTPLEAARRLTSEPSEDERLGVLVSEVSEQQQDPNVPSGTMRSAIPVLGFDWWSINAQL